MARVAYAYGRHPDMTIPALWQPRTLCLARSPTQSPIHQSQDGRNSMQYIG